MRLAASLPTAIIVLALHVLTTGCGGADRAAPTAEQTAADVQPQSEAPALPPDGATARSVTYRCNSGREGTLVIDLPDLDRLAERLDRIDPCEYDNGLSRATVNHE
jgi:hypothetical protein